MTIISGATSSLATTGPAAGPAASGTAAPDNGAPTFGDHLLDALVGRSGSNGGHIDPVGRRAPDRTDHVHDDVPRTVRGDRHERTGRSRHDVTGDRRDSGRTSDAGPQDAPTLDEADDRSPMRTERRRDRRTQRADEPGDASRTGSTAAALAPSEAAAADAAAADAAAAASDARTDATAAHAGASGAAAAHAVATGSATGPATEPTTGSASASAGAAVATTPHDAARSLLATAAGQPGGTSSPSGTAQVDMELAVEHADAAAATAASVGAVTTTEALGTATSTSGAAGTAPAAAVSSAAEGQLISATSSSDTVNTATPSATTTGAEQLVTNAAQHAAPATTPAVAGTVAAGADATAAAAAAVAAAGAGAGTGSRGADDGGRSGEGGTSAPNDGTQASATAGADPSSTGDAGAADAEAITDAAPGDDVRRSDVGRAKPLLGRISTRELDVDLSGEGLGTLRLHASAQGGALHVALQAADPQVRDAIARHAFDLRRDLERDGIQLGSFDVGSHPDRHAREGRDQHAPGTTDRTIAPPTGGPHVDADPRRATGAAAPTTRLRTTALDRKL